MAPNLPCAVYTVVTNGYDEPASISPNNASSRCKFFFLHDGMSSMRRFERRGWHGIVMPFAANESGKLQASEHKLRRPACLASSATVYVDGNVGIHGNVSELVELCASVGTLCMFSVGRTVNSELNWLEWRKSASSEQRQALVQRYSAHLSEKVWYGKVIVRLYGSARLPCFEDQWLAALSEPGGVQRDQVHINRALARCNQSVHDLRSIPLRRHQKKAPPPYQDPTYRRYFSHSSFHAGGKWG